MILYIYICWTPIFSSGHCCLVIFFLRSHFNLFFIYLIFHAFIIENVLNPVNYTCNIIIYIFVYWESRLFEDSMKVWYVVQLSSVIICKISFTCNSIYCLHSYLDMCRLWCASIHYHVLTHTQLISVVF